MAERFTTQDLEQFLATCEPYLRRTCRRLARNDALGDDLCHDVWIAVKKAAPQFRGDCAPVTFVYGEMSRSTATSRPVLWRRRQRRRSAGCGTTSGNSSSRTTKKWPWPWLGRAAA
ncbi:MAG: hypothetical protein E6J90_49385 [Deltaproteobacteria bacterium]|nr:MAG: hypothetical protein E6J90_49385 [Deltaproteobacteria bacterium]